jgi:predicted nucleic acid-binding protein
MTRGDLLFLDTNVLLGSTDSSRPEHRACKRLFAAASPAGVHLACTGQILREYLVVATRPIENNGLGLAPADALRNVRSFRTRMHLLPETNEVAIKLGTLVAAHTLLGARIHDANLVASMTVHGIVTLVTLNARDFGIFDQTRLLTPAMAETLMAGLAGQNA